MIALIYVPQRTKLRHKKQLDNFAAVYFDRLKPTFADITTEADSAAQEYYDDILNRAASDDFDDASSVAEDAIEKGQEKYEMLSLGQYTLTAAWHATLYEFFEQQVRLFLYKEISHDFVIEFEGFCTSMKAIKECPRDFSFKLESVSSWPVIDELRLLCNVIKHSDGTSAIDLKKRNPRLFKCDLGIDYLKLYRTTLLEITLNIDDSTLNHYLAALKEFWNEIPERNLFKGAPAGEPA